MFIIQYTFYLWEAIKHLFVWFNMNLFKKNIQLKYPVKKKHSWFIFFNVFFYHILVLCSPFQNLKYAIERQETWHSLQGLEHPHHNNLTQEWRDIHLNQEHQIRPCRIVSSTGNDMPFPSCCSAHRFYQ